MFELADWVLSLKDIDGVAFSGGEPMQQAPSLMFVMDLIHKSRPSLSFNMYTGYSYRELEEGRFKWKSAYDARWIKGTEKLWGQIRQHLDFAIMGRFNERFVTIEKPLCGSLNQDVVFFNDRYSAKDLEKQVFEVTIKAGGENATLTGFPVGIDKTAFSR